MKGSQISIIIPVKDSVEKLSSTLQSIIHSIQLSKDTVEIVVVNDDANPDIKRYVENLQTERFKIPCIDVVPSQGSYHARNEGIKKANGDLFLFLDVPLKFSKGWMQDVLEASKSYDYIAGNIRVPPEECTTLAEKLYAATAFPVESYFREQHFGPTAFLAVKRKVFNKIGLFDTLYSGGDMQFGQSVKEAGFSMTFLKDTVVWHPPRNLKQQFWKKVRVYKGIKALNKLHENGSSTFQSILSLWNCITAIPANLIKFRKNRIYRSGLFTCPEYIAAVFQFWGIEFFSRLYVMLIMRNT